MKVWIVDAFATKPYTGNPAGVVFLDRFPIDEVCQSIAAELNLSETVFIVPCDPGRFRLRWFTPTVEVKLCGHATLASAHILYQQNVVERDEEIVFDTLSGPLKVFRNNSLYTLDLPLQNTGERFVSPFLKRCFGKEAVAVQAYDDVLVELPTEEEVRNYRPSFHELAKIDCRGIIVAAKGSGPYDFVSRFFAPRVGVNEDPVTGSAHCKLAHYWQKKLHRSEFLAYQASARGGEIALAIAGDRVRLTGGAITVLEGTWRFGMDF